MATSTNKAKNFFDQRKKAIPTTTVINAAANTPPPANTAPIPVPPKKQASGKKSIALLIEEDEKILRVEMPEYLKNFIMANNFASTAKINANIPVEIDNKLQIALLQLKSKYGLNNRQINKTVLLAYIIDKALREDELFK
jgi:hypothetical protein